MAKVDLEHLALIKRFYYGRGWSVREIADYLGKGTDAIYYFMRKHGLKRRDRSSRNKALFARKPLSYHVPNSLSKTQQMLKTAGILLYWAEGAKRGHVVDFANSDPDMCVIFLRFLREVCHIDETRLRGFLYCHDTADPEQLTNYWSRLLRLPKDKFTQPYVRETQKSTGDRRPHRMEHGLLHIRYADLRLHSQIIEWIIEWITTWAGSEAVKRTTL